MEINSIIWDRWNINKSKIKHKAKYDKFSTKTCKKYHLFGSEEVN